MVYFVELFLWWRWRQSCLRVFFCHFLSQQQSKVEWNNQGIYCSQVVKQCYNLCIQTFTALLDKTIISSFVLDTRSLQICDIRPKYLTVLSYRDYIYGLNIYYCMYIPMNTNNFPLKTTLHGSPAHLLEEMLYVRSTIVVSSWRFRLRNGNLAHIFGWSSAIVRRVIERRRSCLRSVLFASSETMI